MSGPSTTVGEPLLPTPTPASDRDPLRDRLRSELFGSPRTPVRIGRFVVLRELGAGAMGRVHAAYDEQLDRKVAIKVLQPDHVARAPARARLLREAQALARLTHPNVVTVYEVGELDDEVYLVMELVAGQTLRTWQSDDSRPWREVLQRYVEAGRGLAAAHAAGLVHRDFKPDNVLLGDDGRVRVADFGLAFADADELTAVLDEHEREASAAESRPVPALEQPLTHTGTRLGTPAYMSPEQLGGRPCDARSDLFSFCVALHEALLGTRPFRGASPTELLAQMITRPTPSARDTKIPRWVSEAIAKGLAREADDRHPSMDALLHALTRRLERRRTGLALAGGSALGLSALAWWPAADEPCARAGDEIETIWSEEARTSMEAAFVGTGLSFADASWRSTETTLDDYAERWAAAQLRACEDTHVRNVQSTGALDLRRACLDGRRRELVALVELLRDADADAVEHASEAVAALPGVGACDDLQRLRSGVEPPPVEIATVVEAHGESLARARAARRLGRYDQAEQQLERVLESAEELDYAPLWAEALVLRGSLFVLRGETDTAESVLLDAVDMAEGSRHDELAADAWLELGYLAATRLRDPTQAQRWARRARAAVTRLGRPKVLDGQALVLEGHQHLLARELDAAENAYRAAIERRSDAFGPDHPEVAAARTGLARVFVERGRATDARAEYRRAIEIFTAALGPGHPRLGEPTFDLAMVGVEAGELPEAAARLDAVLEIYTQAYGPDAPRLVHVLLARAQVEDFAGRLEGALIWAERALAVLEGSEGSPADRVTALQLMGTLRYRQRQWVEAEQAFEEALRLVESTADPEPLDVATSLSNLADALLPQGRTDEAGELYRRALALMEAELPADHGLLAYPLEGLGRVALAQDRPADAANRLGRAVELHRAHPGDRPALASARWSLARALANEDQSEARLHAEAAREIFADLGDTASRDELDAWLESQPSHDPAPDTHEEKP